MKYFNASFNLGASWLLPASRSVESRSPRRRYAAVLHLRVSVTNGLPGHCQDEARCQWDSQEQLGSTGFTSRT